MQPELPTLKNIFKNTTRWISKAFSIESLPLSKISKLAREQITTPQIFVYPVNQEGPLNTFAAASAFNAVGRGDIPTLRRLVEKGLFSNPIEWN